MLKTSTLLLVWLLVGLISLGSTIGTIWLVCLIVKAVFGL